MEQGTGKIKNIVPAEAVAAEMVETGSKRNTATLTAGGSDESKVNDTVGAE